MSGLEPPTPTLSGWCSNLLSYIPLFVVNTKVFMLGGGCPPYVLRLRYERFAQGGAQSAEHNEQNCLRYRAQWTCVRAVLPFHYSKRFVIITKLN